VPCQDDAGDSLGASDGLDRSGADGLERSGAVLAGAVLGTAGVDADGLVHAAAAIEPTRARASRILLIMSHSSGL
jgi:hypothetical protein